MNNALKDFMQECKNDWKTQPAKWVETAINSNVSKAMYGLELLQKRYEELENRATPMKPLNYGFGYSDVCPTCNASVTDDETDTKYNFCRVCGQALGESETK